MIECSVKNELAEKNDCWCRYQQRKCEGFFEQGFYQSFFQIEPEEVCAESSLYGNDYFILTDDDIEALKNGKILGTVDEYGVFIMYEPEEREKRE